MNVLLVNPRFPIAFYSMGELSCCLGHKTTNPPLGLAHATTPPRTAKPPAGAKGQAVMEFRLLAAFLRRHGVASSYRMQFWRQFLTVALKHPSRFRSYVALCIKCGIYAEFAKRSRARAVALGLAPATG